MEQGNGPTRRRWAAPFFTIWAGQQFSLVGSLLAQFALVWWLTQETGSATVLAMATMAAVIPQVILGPAVGALVDRWNRRTVMVVADGAIALASAWLALLFWTGAMQVWHVYVIVLLRSLGEGFHWPAMMASTSLMVPKQHLARLAGLNQTVRGIMSFVVPPLAALLLGVLPLPGIMTIDMATAVLAIGPLLFIAIPQPPRRPTTAAVARQPSLWQEMWEGLRFIGTWPGLLALLLMATVINFLLNPAFALMPILVTKHFQGQALHLGALESASGIGVILGGLALSVWGGFRRRILTTLAGLIGMGMGIVLIGLTPSSAFLLAVGGMFITGLMNPITNGPIMALMQDLVPAEMQGRVFTVTQSIAAAMSPLGLAVAGPVADLLGVRTWYLVGGMTCLLMGLVSLLIPAIARMEDRPAPAHAGSVPATVERVALAALEADRADVPHPATRSTGP